MMMGCAMVVCSRDVPTQILRFWLRRGWRCYDDVPARVCLGSPSERERNLPHCLLI